MFSSVRFWEFLVLATWGSFVIFMVCMMLAIADVEKDAKSHSQGAPLSASAQTHCGE